MESKLYYCFVIILENGDVEFYNVHEYTRERAFMHATLAWGTRASEIKLAVIMEPS